jgi:hypothetical protein
MTPMSAPRLHHAGTACLVFTALVFGIPLTARQSLDFEITSIKRNVTGAPATDVRRLPDGTFIAVNISVRNVLGSAWRSEDFEYRNLPGWAIGNRYGVTVKPVMSHNWINRVSASNRRLCLSKVDLRTGHSHSKPAIHVSTPCRTADDALETAGRAQ